MRKLDHQIDELAGLVQRAERMTIFTGAGFSTECGIPDFRSPDGFWTKHRPIEFGEFLSSEETRLDAWRRFFRIHELVQNSRPGRAHMLAAEWIREGRANAIITQNIDGLHFCNGITPDSVIELHGNGTYATCLECGERHELEWVAAVIELSKRPPACQTCGGIVKSATISFGQPMPENELARARSATLDSDLFLAMGSSLQVYPAAGFPVMAKQNGAKLVIVNREPTGLDGLADLVINQEIGETLAALQQKLSRRIS